VPLAQDTQRLVNALAPQVRCVVQRDLAVFDVGIDRLFALALEDEPVKARPLELGCRLLPLKTSPSKPAHLSLAAVQPPMWASATVPVSGDLVTTARRPLIFTFVPVNGPFITHRMFSGDSGSTSGPLSKTYLTPKPRAPIYLRASVSSIPLYSTSPDVRSTQAIRFANPPIMMLLLCHTN